MRAIGLIVPSCNRVVERITAAILAGVPGVSAHFTRVKTQEYTPDDVRRAAELLSDAKVDAICWSATEGVALGFDSDIRLGAAIHTPTGASSVTSALATLEILKRRGARRVALVTPYTDEHVYPLVEAFAAEGVAIAAERHLGLADSYTFSAIPPATIAEMTRAAMAAAPVDAALVFCTNLEGAPVAASVEIQTDRLVIDAAAAGLWKALRAAGVDTRALAPRWGRLFAEE